MLSTRFGGETSDLVRYPGLPQFGAHTCVMREADFRDAETLLIRLSHLARPNREAALILERVKLYLADQFDRGDHPYVLPTELAAAGKTTCRFFPREGDTPGMSTRD